tara:strand:- start:532 stop:1227 length:696 start_codon:yes stop_codon:yes gene_type:complete
MNFKHFTTSSILALCALCLLACQHKPTLNEQVKQMRWINPDVFNASKHTRGSLYSFEFDMTFSAVNGENVTVTNCLELALFGEDRVSPPEYIYWQSIKIDCEVVERYYLSSENAVSYWPESFDYELIKQFPATTLPYVGGQTLEGRTGTLSAYDANLKFIEKKNDNQIHVDVDDMDVYYVQLARADFNRDGVQDIFVRMDWYVKDAFGKGTDWVVLTKLSPNSAPMMLWRK